MSYSLSKKFTFGSLILFALPTTVMMIVMSLYSIIDGVFVSRFVSTNALSSVNIVYPLINIVLGVSVMLSAGSNAIVAKKMGEGKPGQARETFTSMVVLNLLLGAAIAFLGNAFAVPLVKLLGASPVLMEDCVTYLRWQLSFSPALMLQILFQMYFVTEGKPGLGLFLTILAGVSNAALDYVFIVPMKLGIAGAAMATVMGYMIPSVIGILYFAKARKALWLVKPRLSMAEFAQTCLNGSSEMVTNLSNGVITFLFNLLMMRFAGEDGVAAITIIQYSQFLLGALFMGFSQGVSPVISYNYGSKNETQLKGVFKTAMVFTAITSALVFLFAELAGPVIVGIFAPAQTPVFALARHGFTIFAIGFLFNGLNTFSSALFTALSDGTRSAVISLVRTFVLIVISLIVFPLIMGIDGVWIAVPVAELGASLLCLYYLKKYKGVYRFA